MSCRTSRDSGRSGYKPGKRTKEWGAYDGVEVLIGEVELLDNEVEQVNDEVLLLVEEVSGSTRELGC